MKMAQNQDTESHPTEVSAQDSLTNGLMNVILDSLPSGLIVLKGNGEILRLNSRAHELLGLSLNAGAVYAKTGDLPESLSPLRELLENSEEDIQRSELALTLATRPDEESTLGFTLKHLTIEMIGPVKVMVFSDITNILKDRLAMELIKEELYQSKKMASVGTMISGVVHELNNPLTGISMSTELTRLSIDKLMRSIQPSASNAAPSVPPAKIQASLENALTEVGKIASSSKKAAALVSDLLTYSRPAQLKLVPCSMQALVDECIQAIKTHPEFTGVVFQMEPLSESTQILCEKVKLEQVFYNLFKNASDAMDRKGTIRVRLEVSSGNSDTKKHVILHVEDHGVGMDKQTVGRIFDPFFTTKGSSGLGLGLSLSYRTIEQHGGILSLDSVLGEGTTFHVAIPIYEEAEGQYPV